MKKSKIPIILFAIFIITCVVLTSVLCDSKELDPSNNENLLFLERYYKLELPKCKKINVLDGNKNSRSMIIELTVKKEHAEQFLKNVESVNFDRAFESIIWKRYYTEKQKEMLVELSKKENSISFRKLAPGRYVMANFQLGGVCYKKLFSSDYIIFIEFYTIETEKELIKNCGKEWYNW